MAEMLWTAFSIDNSPIIDYYFVRHWTISDRQKAEDMRKQDRKNAFFYCRFRDEQYALYDDYAKSSGMYMNTFLIANALFYSKGGMTQKQICEAIHHSKQTVSQIIKTLARDGYVSLEENPEDRRNKIVRLTESGRRWCEKPVRHITNAEDTAMSMFTPEEQEQLVSLSRRFTENLTALVKGSED